VRAERDELRPPLLEEALWDPGCDVALDEAPPVEDAAADDEEADAVLAALAALLWLAEDDEPPAQPVAPPARRYAPAHCHDVRPRKK
jgi:hypothetical protein